jgi:hypothetical protein
MEIHQLRQLIREETKRALNEGPDLSSDANNLIKKGKDISQQISTLQRELSTSKQELSKLETQYEKLIVDAGKESIDKIESALKYMFPNAKITNRVDEVHVDLSNVEPRVLWKNTGKPLRNDSPYRLIGLQPISSDSNVIVDENKFISDLEKKAGLPKGSVIIIDFRSINLYYANDFSVALNRRYKKTALNFPNWSDAVRA